MAKPANIVGQTFNNLTVLRDSGLREHRKVIFECRCSCGNIVNVRGAAIVSGNTKSCGKCSFKTILNPLTVYYTEFLQALSDTYSYAINGDILELPDAKLAFHLCLNATSHTGVQQDTKYNWKLYRQYRDMGYRLITLYENEWKDRKAQVVNLVESVLHKHTTNVFARKCSISEIDKQTAYDFLDKYHIQGKANAGIKAYGLKYNNEIIAVMTFNVHHRGSVKDVVVLNRFAVKSFVSIPGGASKLLSHAIKDLKKLKYIKLISWADLRYSYGNVYEKLGFTLDETLSIDYCYYNTFTGLLESKQSNKKGILNTPVGMTELQHTKVLGKERIYDCGKLRFEMNI